MKHILTVIFALLLFTGVSHAQVVERSVEATESLSTGIAFIYQGVSIPVLDVSYHQWSADSITWRKNYVAGDCYLRFSNDTKGTWGAINVCGGTGTGTSKIDTVIVCSEGVCDTITTGKVTVNIPAPILITGDTGNTQTDSTHTHAVTFYMGDVENVDTTAVVNGYVLKWNNVTKKWVGAPDLIGGSTPSLVVEEYDGIPSVPSVDKIIVANGRLTDEGIGTVSIDFTLEPVNGQQNFFRTDTVDVLGGDTFLTFSSPLPANDYVVVNAFAQYSDGQRQSLSYDSTTVNGFRVLEVLGASEVHYLVMRNLDSLGLAVTNQGMIMASGSDPLLGYLNQKVDDTTITVINNDLHVIPEFDSIMFDTTYTVTGTEPTGTVYWDQDNNTTSRVLKGGVILQDGQEVHIYGKNTSGAIIPNGAAVSIAAATGAFTAFELTDISTPNAYAFAGLATQEIGINEFGYVTKSGVVRGLDTGDLDEGKSVYVSIAPGQLTDTFPRAENIVVIVGVCEYSHANNGRINVISSVIPKIQDASGVNGTALSKNGQIMVYNNDSSFFDFDYNIIDTTATVNFEKSHIDTLTVTDVVYSDTYWDDMRLPITAAAPGVNAPDLVPFGSTGGLQLFGFAGAVRDETVYLEGQFSHRIKETSDIEPHIHFSPTTTPAATDTAVFEFEYSWLSLGDVNSVTDTIITKVPVCDYLQWEHGIVGMSETITGIGDQESSIISARFTRKYAHPSDTYTSDLIVFTLDIHYEIDKPGSRNAIPD